jgi:capsule polysaccharide export protein KpsE/RkpR
MLAAGTVKLNEMTVKELKEALAKYPDNMDVFVAERKTEFSYGLVNSIRSEEITFAENPDFDEDEEVQAKDTVVIIDEE